MIPTNIKYRKSLRGIVVTYDCPHCDSNLKSPLEEAGKDDHCPKCGSDFVVPGTEYREHLRDLETRQSQQEDKERLEKERLREEKRRQQELDRAAKDREEEKREKEEEERINHKNKVDREIAQNEAKLISEMEPINYISKGLAFLVKIFLTQILFVIVYGFIIGFASNMQDPDDILFCYLLLFVAAIIALSYTLDFAKLAYTAFEEGSKPKKKS